MRKLNNMWTTFRELIDSIVSNIDDFFVIILIAIIGNKIANFLYVFLHSFMELSLFTSQSVKIFLQIFLFSTCLIQLLGGETLASATGGIAIGVGYAFQPYIISVFNGLMIHNDDIINNKKWISLLSLNIVGEVQSVGLFNTVINDINGNTILISNSSLTRGAVKVLQKRPVKNVSAAMNIKEEDGPHDVHYLQHAIAEHF